MPIISETQLGSSVRRSTEQAVATLLASEDPWLRSSAVYAVGMLSSPRPTAQW